MGEYLLCHCVILLNKTCTKAIGKVIASTARNELADNGEYISEHSCNLSLTEALESIRKCRFRGIFCGQRNNPFHQGNSLWSLEQLFPIRLLFWCDAVYCSDFLHHCAEQSHVNCNIQPDYWIQSVKC